MHLAYLLRFRYAILLLKGIRFPGSRALQKTLEGLTVDTFVRRSCTWKLLVNSNTRIVISSSLLSDSALDPLGNTSSFDFFVNLRSLNVINSVVFPLVV